MGLTEDIRNIRMMQNVFKSFSKAEEALRSLSTFEAKERESKNTLGMIKNACEDAQSKLDGLDEKLLLKKESVGKALLVIDSEIKEKKAEKFAELAVEIAEVEANLDKLKVDHDAAILRNSDLRAEEKTLETKVKTLRKVISDINSIKGV